MEILNEDEFKTLVVECHDILIPTVKMLHIPTPVPNLIQIRNRHHLIHRRTSK